MRATLDRIRKKSTQAPQSKASQKEKLLDILTDCRHSGRIYLIDLEFILSFNIMLKNINIMRI